jgi:hypothetical protein
MKDSNNEDLEFTVDDLFNTELSTKDYGFIMTAEGDLKAVFMPSDAHEILPELIQEVFKLFGIEDPVGVQVHTVH